MVEGCEFVEIAVSAGQVAMVEAQLHREEAEKEKKVMSPHPSFYFS